MIRQLDLSDVSTATHVLDMQRRAYAIEAELIGTDQIPPLTETLSELQVTDEIFYGYKADSMLAGAIAYKREDKTVDIYRMIVHPDYFRRGIARQLIAAIESIESDAMRFIVSTGAANHPAKHLYHSVGFLEIYDETVMPGLIITHFEKRR